MRRQLNVHRLSDEFGQYTLRMTCARCQYVRLALPYKLARLVGWDATLDELQQRLRCSRCGAKECVIDVSPASLRRT
jgi:hypothetical protein